MNKQTFSFDPTWQVPDFEIKHWGGKQKLYCVIIPVINEGTRITDLLKKMKLNNIANIADIIIVDGGSSDNSLIVDKLLELDVQGLLLKTGAGKLSAQLRCAYAFALKYEYRGIVTIDGNNKDDPVAIIDFINALERGYDFVQASRFIKGGVAVNTPKSRDFAIKYIHAPMLSFFSGFKWTDTTQGFRAYSSIMLSDKDIGIFRNVFDSYELLAYLSYRVPKLGFKCIELPTTRIYPKGEIPTKISSFRGNFTVFKTLISACFGRFNPN
ncbi:glycosyltransferase family 2 protein [Thorsellia anophelis]|uniref:Dolichol-phosphate mannosyltransferase n=1 Tax=Thorsellia anophelis DSM 18579 TaxID=1123402 RepID=A0A1I0FEQ8_9GAMM|nr:glycosyltransferase family 2 protein [Thorsellia anophelis]SET56756.1 dolichol-phosphate mannosyltransferase [Thorsellia anophelis DSM 18579]